MDSSVLTTKGQIVILKGLRDKYKLKPGTVVFFEDTAAGIILKQVDEAFIRSAKGVVPKKKGGKAMSDWWLEYKAEERALEDKQFNLLSEPQATYKKAVKINRKK